MLGGRWPVLGVCGAASSGEYVAGIERVGSESVAQDGGMALGAGAGGDGVWVGGKPIGDDGGSRRSREWGREVRIRKERRSLLREGGREAKCRPRRRWR